MHNPLKKFAFVNLIIVTLFTQSLLASPVAPDPKVNKPSDNQKFDSENTQPLSNVDIAEPQPTEVQKNMYFYKYERSYSVLVAPTYVSNNEGVYNSHVLLELNYLWKSPTSFHIESGVAMLTNNQGQFWTSGRWNWDSTMRLRKYLSVGAGVKLIASDMLATFLRLTNYFARGAAGLEYSFSDQWSWRTELFAGNDFGGRVHAGLSLGYTYGF